jgi:hypothetical protein
MSRNGGKNGGPSVALTRAVNSSTARGSDAGERQVVLLIEPSAHHRAALARALVAAGFDVRSLETLGTARTPRFAIVNLEDLKEKDADTLLAALLDRHREVPLVLRSSDPGDAEAGARTLGLNVALSFAKDALEREVVARICQWCRPGSAGGGDGPKSAERLAPALLKRVPTLAVGRDVLARYKPDLDQASFLASIDGRRDLEAIAARTGMTPSVVLNVARKLVERRIVVLR